MQEADAHEQKRGVHTINGVFPNTAFIFWSVAGINSSLSHEKKEKRKQPLESASTC
jgi:hypothetical protein